MKRKLALVAVLLFALAFLAACNNNNDNGGTTADTGATSGTTDPITPPAGGGATAEAPPATRERVSFTFSGTGDLDALLDDDVFHYIQDSLNVDIEHIAIGEGMIDLMAAVGELPDIFFFATTFMEPSFYNWIDDGLIRSIPRDMIARNPEISRIVNWSREVNGVADVRNGEIWFLPRPFDYRPNMASSTLRLWYRADLAADMGIPTPQTTDDLWELFRAFTEDDPHGDGTHTFGMSAPGNWTMISPFTAMIAGIDMDGWSQLENGDWVPNWSNPRMIEAIQWLRDAWDAGFIDPEYALSTWQVSLELLATGRTAVVPRNGGDVHWVMATNRVHAQLQGDPDWLPIDSHHAGHFRVMPVLTHQGRQTAWPPQINSDGYLISANVDDALLERILEFVEWGMHPDRVLMRRHGMEGQTWNRAADGSIELVINPETDQPYLVWQRFPSIELLNIMTWDFNVQWDPDQPEGYRGQREFRAESLRINESYNAAGIVDCDIAFMLRVARLPAFLNVMNFVVPLVDFADMVTGTQPVEVMWNNYMAEWNAMGLQAAIEEANAFVAGR